MRIGVDLGGTKIEVAAFDPHGAEIWSRRGPTPTGDYDATIAAIRELVNTAEEELRQRATVGVGHPGAERVEDDLIKNANSTCLNGKPLRRDLESALGRRVPLANDADCFAISEAHDGAGQGARVVFGVILGTGVGGGVVVDGRPLLGPNRIAGEWGHNPLPSPTADDLPARDCYCGRSGCVETYLSGPGWLAEHLLRDGEGPPPTGSEEIVRRAEAGDRVALASLSRYTDRLARSLAIVMNILDPDVIVLGGGLSNIDALYRDVPALIGPHLFSDSVRTRIARNVHGDSSGVRGAAWLGAEEG